MAEDLRDKVNRYLINSTEFLKVKDQMTEDQLRAFVNRSIDDMINEQDLEISMEERGALIKSMVSAVLSLGPLRPLMEDETITEIMVNGYDTIYIQRFGKIEKTDVKFESNAALAHTTQKILATSESNKRCDESNPYVDFSLRDGSRVNAILPPCSLMGPVLTIRKFKEDIGSTQQLLEIKELNDAMHELLVAGMKSKCNVIFCGATGAGKTTCMNCFSTHIPEEERIITIEDTPELNLMQDHVVRLQSKPPNIEGKGEITMADLFTNSLRMRPDRIIIGEIRGKEMLDLIQSISSGHSGSLAIVHAESPEDCFSRMVTMMLMTGIRLSNAELQKQVARAVDMIVHVELYNDGVRRIANITDVVWDEEKQKTYLHDIWYWKQTGDMVDGVLQGDWVKNRRIPSFMQKFIKHRVEFPKDYFDKE
ncbi:MAG: CpaF family protein [Candidatus Omnitrophica bacterium]|nr:CpaF family protein [Candidatus Omnitrophota bacterium]